jgi:hypothetical protein
VTAAKLPRNLTRGVAVRALQRLHLLIRSRFLLKAREPSKAWALIAWLIAGPFNIPLVNSFQKLTGGVPLVSEEWVGFVSVACVLGSAIVLGSLTRLQGRDLRYGGLTLCGVVGLATLATVCAMIALSTIVLTVVVAGSGAEPDAILGTMIGSAALFLFGGVIVAGYCAPPAALMCALVYRIVMFEIIPEIEMPLSERPSTQ